MDHARYFRLRLAHPKAPHHRGERLRISIKHAERFYDYLSLQKQRVHRWPESGNMSFVLEDVAGWILSIYLETIYQSTRRNWNMSPLHSTSLRSGMGKTYRVQSFIHTSCPKPNPYLLTANSPFGSFLHSGHNHSPAGSFLSPTQVQWNH